MQSIVRLPNLPKECEFEEFVAAHLQAHASIYTERNIIDRDGHLEILEIDILSTSYESSLIETILIEVKSGSWGFPDLFKIKGQLVYQGISRGYLIVPESSRDDLTFIKEKASDIGVELVPVNFKNTTLSLLGKPFSAVPDCRDINCWRFSFWVERNLKKHLKKLKKENLDKECYKITDQCLHKINSSVLYSKNILTRVTSIYEAYKEHPNLSAKAAHELNGSPFSEDVNTIPREQYWDAFNGGKVKPLHITTYVEHRARLSILKYLVDYKISADRNIGKSTKIFGSLDFMPNSFKDCVDELAGDSYFHLYAVFWQWFLWIFGGFILLDKKDEEYELLSVKTGIPYSNIEKALSIYDKLFPTSRGWFARPKNSSLQMIKMFPPQFMGIGANFRKMHYAEDKEFSDLNLDGDMTLNDLIKWNNSLVHLLVED